MDILTSYMSFNIEREPNSVVVNLLNWDLWIQVQFLIKLRDSLSDFGTITQTDTIIINPYEGFFLEDQMERRTMHTSLNSLEEKQYTNATNGYNCIDQ